MPPASLRERPAFSKLLAHHREVEPQHLREMFKRDPERAQRFSAHAAGIDLDYSKNRITDETVALLLELARESAVEQRREAMFAGEHINVSEDRAALHVALRMPRDSSLVVDGTDV